MENKQIEIFKSDDGSTVIEVQVEKETVWLNQNQISDLFLTDRTSIGRHISNIFKTKELNENSTSAKIALVRDEGKRIVTRQIGIYNLDVILSVGYRVHSAANLLYFITKNHSFSDGNKRIAAILFIYFLDKNGILFDAYGNKRIADTTLVALTLMIAVSKSDEKDTMAKVIISLINKSN